ncbi:MAG TPA: type II toxin-antitoxin system HicB family antitoxin [Kofleriaceae bacterium]|jgi:predicted RNase H-like HicB family nuclease/DNA-binding XRE family transcriptional regulator|nr:type II toxin-antitoxin system HicB family antitoxin [Kofleriaceae bacterium]
MQYVAKLAREGKHWTVSFPDCPGCQTFGKTKDEALAMAAEALDGWLETHLEYGDVPPRPKPHRGGVPIEVRAALDVAIQLRWLRDKLALTQAGLAKRVGVSQQQIAKLEKATSNPTLQTLVDLTTKVGSRVLIELSPPAGSRKGLIRKRARSSTSPGTLRRTAGR